MRKLVCLATLALALVPSSVAGAQGLENTYRGETDVLGEVGEVTSPSASSTNQGQPEAQPVQPTAAAPPAPAAPQEAASGTLPFTGSEVLLAVLAGVALLGAGFGLRRLSAGNRSA